MPLGQRLVKELRLEDSADTLGRWMAHYIEELIVAAETATGKAKQVAQRACADAILEVWRHRSELPSGHRPFQDIEPISRAVESLDPENPLPRYYRNARPPNDGEAETSEQRQWLDIAEGLDYAARVLIGYCLAEAAAGAIDKSKEWVALATPLKADGVPEIVVRIVAKAADINREPDPNSAIRSLLSDRVERMRAFRSIADIVTTTLEQRLKALPPPEKSAEDEDRIVMTTRPKTPKKLPRARRSIGRSAVVPAVKAVRSRGQPG